MSLAPPAAALPAEPPARAPAPARVLRIAMRHEERTELLTLGAAVAPPAGLIPGLETHLAPAELDYVRGVPTAKRRAEYLLGRYAAKSALAAWLPAPPASLARLAIRPGAFQQPVVDLPGAAVTLAHSRDLALAAAHDVGHPLGIDLEHLAPAHLPVLASQLSPADLLPALDGHPDALARHTLTWVVMEALAKALRCGLTCPVELLAPAAVTAHADHSLGAFRNFGQYQFAAWFAGPCACALVCSRRAALAAHVPAIVRFTREAFAPAA